MDISVTMPVYNVEEYLPRCLETILNQTFKGSYEIICVDDGSTDNSGKILDKYASKYPNIKVIHQENQSLSVARNVALEHVTGKYTMFVDSDDFIASNALESLYKIAESTHSDVVVFSYVVGDSTGKQQGVSHYQDVVKKYGPNSFNIETADAFVYRFIPCATWCKFYLTSLVKDIKFIPNLNNQDRPHWAEVYSKAKKITYLPVAYYFYVMKREGCITLKSNKSVFNVFTVFTETEKVLRKYGYFEKLKYIHYTHFCNCLFNALKKIDEVYLNELIKKIKEYNIDIDFTELLKSDVFEFEKENIKLIKFIKHNNYRNIKKKLKKIR